MFDYRKSNRSSQPKASGLRQPAKSNPSGPPSMAASSHSQASGLAYIRTLKANLQRSASQILAPPGSGSSESLASSAKVDSTDDIVNPQAPQAQTDAERQAETAMADEKDKISVAEELQRYIEEGVLDEVEYKEFSLTRYWQVSDCLTTHYFMSLKHQYFILLIDSKISVPYDVPGST